MSFDYTNNQYIINSNPVKGADIEIDSDTLPGGKCHFIGQDKTQNNTGHTLVAEGTIFKAYKIAGTNHWINRDVFIHPREINGEGFKKRKSLKKRKSFGRKSLKKRKTFRRK